MQLIQTVTVGAGGAASIEFGVGGTIPQTFTDLLIVLSARSTRTDQGARSTFSVQFNGITTGYSYRRLFGIPSLATNSDSGSGSDAFLIGYQTSNAATTNAFGNGSLYLPNYRSSNNKTGSADSVGESNDTSIGLSIVANLWSNNSPITSIKIQDPGYSLTQYSSASLYGITAGSDGIVTVS